MRLRAFQFAICILFGREVAYSEYASRSVTVCCHEYAREQR